MNSPIGSLDSKSWHTMFPFILSLFVIGTIAILFWPGYMSPDSIGQLNQGLSGNYSDHHPPMMSFCWRMLHFIYTGSQAYLIFQLFLLLCAICILQTIVKQWGLKCMIALILLIPNIAAYSGAIWKDVSFAYSFLLAAMLLLQSNILRRKLTYSKIVLILLLLIYGVGVKYQAQFVLPVMSLWLGLSMTDTKLNFKAVFIAVIVTAFVFLSVFLFNKTLVPAEKKQYSWQMVKLYDLVGMSLRVEKNLLPEFVTSAKDFSMESVKQRYSSERVDELLRDWYPGAPLSLAKDEKERDLLWVTWAKAVIHYPSAYLSHRFSVWFNMVSKSPIKPLAKLSSLERLPQKIQLLLKHEENGLFRLIRESTRFVLMLPFLFIYIGLGIYLYKHNNLYGLPLIMMNFAGLSLLLVLFIFSMAADLRYIYFSTCFMLFSHPIAFLALQEKWCSNKQRQIVIC